MSQPPDNSGKSKHPNLFHRFKHHLRKNKSGKGKGPAEAEQHAPGPEEGDPSLMSYITAAANQQGTQLEHDCRCEACIAAENPDPSLMGYIQAAASGEANPDIDCECAVCAAHRVKHPQSIEDAYFSAMRHSGPVKKAYFSVPRDADAMRAGAYNTTSLSGHAVAGTQINNPDTGSPKQPTGHEEEYPQIMIPNLEDPMSTPVVADPLDPNPQPVNAPATLPHLLRSLVGKERGHGKGGAGHKH
ncbi:hypothetical protein BGX38DRAFT_1245127 [Terfezia claveryi]|nr:hypothetical protein BGX38DRAFT_1245127 [Terfezia claveryi]